MISKEVTVQDNEAQTSSGQFTKNPAKSRFFRKTFLSLEPSPQTFIDHWICLRCLVIYQPGENSCSQTEGGVVGSLQHFLFCFKGQHGHDRTENLLLHTGHLICAVTCVWETKTEWTGFWKSKDGPLYYLYVLYSQRNVFNSYPTHRESCSIHLWVLGLMGQKLHLRTTLWLPGNRTIHTQV